MYLNENLVFWSGILMVWFGMFGLWYGLVAGWSGGLVSWMVCTVGLLSTDGRQLISDFSDFFLKVKK